MADNINIPLISTPNDLEQWLKSYRLSKYPDDEPGVWSTHGRISYHSPEYGIITFVIKAPAPGKLLVDSIEYEKRDQSQIYVDNLIDEIISQFGELSSPNSFSTISESELLDQLDKSFNKSELNDLCFSLEIEHENLSGETKKDKARELIKYCRRHGKFEELIKKCKSLRAHLSWEKNDAESTTLNKLSSADQYQIALHWAENGRKESLYGFDLSGCVLWAVDFERVDLRMANLRNADLGRANLQKANLIGADLREASLFNAYLHGAKIDSSTQIDEKSRLVIEITKVGGGMIKRNLRGVDLSNTILVWGELSNADLSEVNLSGSTLVSANLTESNLTKANLKETDLSMANLQGSKLIEAILQNSNLQEADLSGADLRGANLSVAKLTRGDETIDNMFPINLSGAKYNKATIWPKDFNPTKWGAVYEE